MCPIYVIGVSYMSDYRKRVQVTFNQSQWKLIEKLRGEFGEKDADIVRNIVLAWLAEKSFISSIAKKKGEREHENCP